MKQKRMPYPVRQTILISDLDGTLLDRNQRISVQNQKAIQSFMKRGGTFTIATGRTEHSTLPFAKQLGLKVPLILHNGGKIYCPVEDKVIYEKKMTVGKSFLDKLSRDAGEHLGILIYKDGQVHTPHRNSQIEAYEAKENLCVQRLKAHAPYEQVNKILLIGATPEHAHAAEKRILQEDILCDRVYSELNYLELLPEQVSKGAALLVLKKWLNQETHYTVAVGDQMNDLALLKEADLGVAVGNAHIDLKGQADAITVDHENHAIYEIINMYF